MNSYVSLYEDSEEVGEGRSLPLIDTIESSKENDPEVLYFGKEYTEAFAEQLKELSLIHIYNDRSIRRRKSIRQYNADNAFRRRQEEAGRRSV